MNSSTIIFNNLVDFIRKKQLFFNFLVTGGLSALLYFLIFAVLWQWSHIDYQISFSIAYIISTIFHFYSNRYFTFRVSGADLVPHMIKYVCMLVINYLITFIIMRLLVEKLNLSPYIGMIIASFVNIYYNFLMSRYWVFRERRTI